jgi:DNA polymerase-4
MLPRRILLVDADTFFVAVARLVDPDGAGRARLLIVGGAPGSRGVVCSASYETRAFGVRSAMPISRALKLCPQATCVPVPRGACSRKSREIAVVLARFAPVVQGASIDEWYLDLTGTESLYGERALAGVAADIRAAVRAETGLGVSIGGGTNRLVAKLAVELAKPHRDPSFTGVHVVAPGGEAEFMRRFGLADIPFVGPKFRERLERVGLRTVDDALAADLPTLTRWLGEREARWLHDRVRGIDDGVVSADDARKSVSREETFDTDIARDDALEEELLRLVTRVAADLRAERLTARTISVKLRLATFETKQASRTLAAAVIADRPIYQTARDLLRRLRRASRGPVRLLGVGLSGLDGSSEVSQLALFETDDDAAVETARDRALAETVDRLRAKFGRGAIVPGPLVKMD